MLFKFAKASFPPRVAGVLGGWGWGRGNIFPPLTLISTPSRGPHCNKALGKAFLCLRFFLRGIFKLQRKPLSFCPWSSEPCKGLVRGGEAVPRPAPPSTQVHPSHQVPQGLLLLAVKQEVELPDGEGPARVMSHQLCKKQRRQHLLSKVFPLGQGST